ncbi:type II toxin-antitoxin system VapC family toxin [Leptothrix sp. BB-4]
MIVVDCSYTLAMVMPDAQLPVSLHQAIEGRLVVPALWPFEVANVLRHVVRRGRLRGDEVAEVCARLDAYGIEVLGSADTSVQQRHAAASAHDLTAYDAAYVDLAVQRRCALATLDARMAAAAQRAGVIVLN